ncbi:MAG: hypothetical protein WKG06_13230 [Segetibacter sp.]
MLDKRGEGHSFTNGSHQDNLEGISNPEIPPIGETSEDLPF